MTRSAINSVAYSTETKKRYVTVLSIFLFLVISLFSTTAHAQFAGGDGSSGDPYQIATPAQLNEIRNNLSSHFILTADIDLTNAAGDPSGDYWNGGEGWEPIGTLSTLNVRFTGSINGDGYTIKGLFIDRPDQTNIGLFGVTDGAGEISNIQMKEVNVKGDGDVGGLVGYNLDKSIINSYASGSVNGSIAVGGLVGRNNGTVNTSYATGSVNGADEIGGLLGVNNGTLTNSYTTGSVIGDNNVGGLLGYNFGTVTTSYATGSVVVTGSGDLYARGLVGNTDNPATTDNSYWNIETSGQSSSYGGTGLTSEQMRQEASFGGFDFTNDWQIQEGLTFPVLQNNPQDPPPGLPLEIDQQTPAANATDVAPNDPITLTFDADVDETTINSANITIRGQQNGTLAGDWSVTDNEATFNPDETFNAGEVIHIEAGTDVLNSQGIPLEEPYASSFTVTPADNVKLGQYWTVASVGENNLWQSVTYGNGRFVAVSIGATNQVMYSEDGVNWTAVDATESNFWRMVTYGNGRFVAVSSDGTNRVMYSDDGENWKPTSAAEANSWFSVIYGNGRFVAVSTDGTNRVMYSEDGESWTPATAAEANSWRSVTYGNGRFVAVAAADPINNINQVMYSDDGVTWTSTSATVAEDNQWYSVTYGNGRFVAVAATGTNRVMYSEDGQNWTPAAPAENDSWGSVTYGNGRFVAVAGYGTNQVMYSEDGENWTSATAAENNYWTSVTYGNGHFVAVSTDGSNKLMYSVEPLQVTQSSPAANATDVTPNSPITLTFDADVDETTINSDNITIRGQQSGTLDGTWSVTGAEATFTPDEDFLAGEVIHVEAGTDMLSSDGGPLEERYGTSFTVAPTQNTTLGETWMAASAAENNIWRSVTYGNGRFVAVSQAGTNQVMYSEDGETWTPLAAAEDNIWGSVTYGNGRFVAVASNGTNRVMYSDDSGETWTPSAAAEDNIWVSVTYGNGRFVAVAIDGTNRVMYSEDGQTWAVSSATESSDWRSVTYGNGRFVAVARDGTNRIMYSDDGINWTVASAPENNNWFSVTYGNGRFVAVSSDGTNQVMYSNDGETWTPAYAMENSYWNSVTYGNGLFVALPLMARTGLCTVRTGKPGRQSPR